MIGGCCALCKSYASRLPTTSARCPPRRQNYPYASNLIPPCPPLAGTTSRPTLLLPSAMPRLPARRALRLPRTLLSLRPTSCSERMTRQSCIQWRALKTSSTTCSWKTTRRVNFRGREPQFLHAAGATTLVMVPAPCTSAVRTSFPTPYRHRKLILCGLNLLPFHRASHTLSRATTSYCLAPSHVAFMLPGLALGGVWGLREGARKPLAVSNSRLRINAILNSVTRRGTFIGNSAGVLG